MDQESPCEHIIEARFELDIFIAHTISYLDKTYCISYSHYYIRKIWSCTEAYELGPTNFV